jgi:hypothetical protein
VRRILSGRERWRLLVEEGSLWKKSVGKQVTTTTGGEPFAKRGGTNNLFGGKIW